MADRSGLALIVAAAALWGTTGTAQALGPESSEPIAVGVVRLLVAAPALLAVAAGGGFLSWPQRASWIPTAIAGAGMAAYQPLFFTAVESTGVALGTVVAIGSAPILAGLLGWIVDAEIPHPRWWGATALAITGVGLIVLSPREDASLTGLIAAAGAGLAFAVYIVASRRVVGLSHPVGGMALVFAIAAVLSLPLLASIELEWLATRAGVIMTLHLGLVATALAYLFFAVGLKSTPTAPAATASLSEPLTATLLGVLLLGEAPGLAAWVGMALIFAGLAVLASDRGISFADGDRMPTKGWR